MQRSMPCDISWRHCEPAPPPALRPCPAAGPAPVADGLGRGCTVATMGGGPRGPRGHRALAAPLATGAG
ncbi:hypothetical protein G6F58_013338 [Rhizopus delemar]|nr:hypothetical protein G6F24_016558 [Rhizopus arrhizus]KAG1389197.1 hypothetical protein G6F58_013338 [Rhizopus delemar]KAG1483291.1 hypothetical protein G6F54_013561 [Rhizopus delemar]